MPSTRIFDAIVVGSGAAGSFAAKTLTESGLDTLVLEAGPQLEPVRDFPELGARDRPGSAFERLHAIVTGQSVQSRATLYRRHLRHLYVNDRDHPYRTASGKPFYWIRGRQVGGRLNTWGRLALRLSDFELRAASRDGHGDDWPIGYSDLAPYYDRVENLLGLEGEPGRLPHLPDGRYLAPHPLSPAELELQRIVEASWPDRRVIPARVLRQDLRRAPLPLRQAETTGRLTLRPNAVVRSLTCDPIGGKATGVEFVDRWSKRIEHARGRLVFLCASAFESVRLLLNSRSTRHPDGIGAPSGVLGRYVADHLFLKANGPLESHASPLPPAKRDPYDFADSQGFYIPSFRNIAAPHREFVRGYGLSGGVGRPGPWWWIGVFGEMLMRPENRVTLDSRRRDAWGVPIARIECAWGPNDRALIADAGRTLEQVLDAAGLLHRARSSRLEAWVDRRSFGDGVAHPGLAIHELGGARMGSNPATSVLDPLCRCWDAQNVIVSDGSCFVSGGYQNPALTIMALSVRAAERAVADFDRIAF